MSDKNTVELNLIAKSKKFRQGMREGEQALNSFQQYMNRVGNAAQALTQKIGFLGNAATALTTGLTLKKLFSVTDYMPVDEALLRMRDNFKATAEEMNAFKDELNSLASKTGMGQGPTFHMASQLSLNYKKEDVEEIIKQTARITEGIQDAAPEAAKEALTQLMKLYKLTSKEAREAADNLITSQVDLESFDMIIQRLAVRGGARKDYVEDLAFLRGLQMAGINKRLGIMKLNESMEVIDKNADMLAANGVTVWTKDAQGNKVWRDKLLVLQDLEKLLDRLKKTYPNDKFRQGALDRQLGIPDAEDKLEFLIKHQGDFKKGIEEMGKAGEIAARRIAAGEATWHTQLEKIKSSLGGIKTDLSFMYDLAKVPIKFIADSPKLTKAGGYLAAGLSVGILSALTYGNIKNAFKGLGTTAAGIAVGKEIQAATGVVPVFVTNAQDIGGGTLNKVIGGSGILTWLKSLLPAGMAAAGMTAGTVGGAVLTTATWVRSLADVMRGGKGDNWINDAFNRQLMAIDRDIIQPIINLNVRIDKDGRVIADSGNKGADLRIDVNRGVPFGTFFRTS